MTPIDKAEAAIAAMRGEVECPECGRYVELSMMVDRAWPYDYQNGGYLTKSEKAGPRPPSLINPPHRYICRECEREAKAQS